MNWKVNNTEIDSSYYNKFCFKEQKFFGGPSFGSYNEISKIFSSLDAHIEVEIHLTLLILGKWDNELIRLSTENFFQDFTFDFYDNYICNENENYDSSTLRDIYINVRLNHFTNSLTFKLKSYKENGINMQSFAIKNFYLFLKNRCHPSCRTCDVGNSINCLTCLPFSFLNSSSQCECVEHFYLETEDYTRCEFCDISCKSCNGPTRTNCTSCYDEDHLDENGFCQHSLSKICFYFIYLF